MSHEHRKPKWKHATLVLALSTLTINSYPPKPEPQKALFFASTLPSVDVTRPVDIGKASRAQRAPVVPQWVAPLTVKYVVTSCYRYRWGTMHYGIDLAVPYGTAIHSVANGMVTQAGWRNGYGYMVTVDHGEGWKTIYAHASRILVKPGQVVGPGSAIARVGSTGNSTGPHLHIGVQKNGQWINPVPFLSNRGVRISGC